MSFILLHKEVKLLTGLELENEQLREELELERRENIRLRQRIQLQSSMLQGYLFSHNKD